MTVQEFSDGFDTLVSSYRRFKDFDNRELLDSVEFNEYEKSLFLTLAQEEVVINYYNGKNVHGDSFESSEELRRYLDSLVKTKLYNREESIDGIGVSNNSLFFSLPSDVSFITLEQVVLEDDSLGCYSGNRVDVFPVTQDEYARVKDNPFRGPTKYKVLRLDSGNNVVELVSKYNISKYLLKYLSKPEPIVLEDLPDGVSINGKTILTECKLNPIIHKDILIKAVQLALSTKSTASSNSDSRRYRDQD